MSQNLFTLFTKCYALCSVARFLESRGMIEDALEIATDPDYRFDLAIQLGKLVVAKVNAFDFRRSLKDHLYPYIAIEGYCFLHVTFYFFKNILWHKQLFTSGYKFSMQEIATVAQSESKWKQLGELAMSTGMVYFYQS